MTTRWPWFATLCVLCSLSVRAADLHSDDLGSPAIAGSMTVRPDGAIALTGAGSGTGARSDQLQFAWQERTNGFDVRVRIETVGTSDVFARAGLMARATPTADGPFAAVLVTPSTAGVLFESRDANTPTRRVGGAPPNCPFLWLRLRREGALFTGAVSYDGGTWTELGNASLPMTDPVAVGLAVTSWNTNQATTAVFRDYAEASGPIAPPQAPPVEVPGPSTRRSGLVISEIMYHPPARLDGRDLEFVELFNSASLFADLSGYRLSGGVDYTFPAGTVLPAGGFLVVARVPAHIRSIYGLTNVLGGYTNRLDNGDGTIRLRDRIDAVLAEARYESQPPWPAAPDGAGHSLVLLRPSYGGMDSRAWGASGLKGGSPGRWDGLVADDLSHVAINEVLTHTDLPEVDYVELYNRGSTPVDLSGAFLSDSPVTNKFRIPTPTVIQAGGHLVFDETQLGFALSAEGETVYFVAPDQSRVIDAVRFGPQGNGISYGRTPDGADTLRALAQKTPGEPNPGPWAGDVVINEIMYHPVSEDDDDEYVELFNRGTNAVAVGGWEFTSGIQFTFDSAATIPAGGYLVVARNAARLRTNYSNLTAQNCVGDFQGSLADGGERLTLARPEPLVSTNLDGVVSTNIVPVTISEVAYADGGRWGTWADGGGSSLELTDSRVDETLAANWANSEESLKGGWTTIEQTGVLDLGRTDYALNRLQFFMEGVGECLVDNLEVIGPDGTNRLANPDFENGMTSWTAQGSYRDSTLETGTGVNGSQCLHVRAQSRGDTGANRVRGNVTIGLREGDTVTLRAQVRWLRGFPEFLMRLRGNWLEAYGRLDTSTHLGTPGASNSRLVANAPPAIYEVAHNPILPAADQPVLVTARARDPDGLGALRLRYRVDPDTNLTEVVMLDDGTGGDALAGDGRFSAWIPGQASAAMVAFHVSAVDAAATPAEGTFPPSAPAEECLVRFGEAQPGSSFGTYHLWMTAATRTRWGSREKLNNAPLPVTFVYGNQRVIYQAASLYAGSPFVSSGYNGPTGGTLCGYIVRMPDDDVFLGATDMNLDWPTRDPSLQMEEVAYWMAERLNLPRNHRRFVHLYVNGSKRGNVYEDAQQPSSELVTEFFPDDDQGDLFKIEDWFEFDDTGSGFVNQDATLQSFIGADGEKKVARYRWNWRKRAVRESANDYQSLFKLVDAVENPGYDEYTRAVESVMDAEEWMRIVALEHIVGNWDSFGFYRGKNMYAYKPERGRWNLLMWDIDFVLGAESYDATFPVLGTTIDPAISRMMFHPPFQRAYYRAIQDAVNGPLKPDVFGPVLSANYAAFQANGIVPAVPRNGSNYMTARLRYLQEQELSSVNVPFSLTLTNDSIETPVNFISLQGTAPVGIREIRINGVAARVQWFSATDWQATIPVSAASSVLEITGTDSYGQLVPGASRTINVHYTGTPESAADRIVFNEIMHHPAVPGAEFVELHNTSTQSIFDLSNWRISGLDYTFPPWSVINPGAFLVLAKNRLAFAQAYGPDVIPFDEFGGELSAQGEALRLVQPGPVASEDVVVTEVTYGVEPPWPAAASTSGFSLQLRDPHHSWNRVGNWAVGLPAAPVDWEQVTVTGTATNSRLLLYLSALPPVRDRQTPEGRWHASINFGGSPFEFDVRFESAGAGAWRGDYIYLDRGVEQFAPFDPVTFSNRVLSFSFPGNPPMFSYTLAADGLSASGSYQEPGGSRYSSTLVRDNSGGDVYLDDLWLVPGTVAEAGLNLVANGDFESPLAGPWTASPAVAGSSLASEAKHGGSASLHLVASAGGYDDSDSLWQDVGPISPGETYTLSYWVHRGTDARGLVVRLADWSLQTARDLVPPKQDPVENTPGRQNSTYAVLPPIPRVWINELQPVNVSGPTDRAGEREPWAELYNAETNDLALAGFSLGDSYTNLARWTFPTNAVLHPGEFHLVWLDEEPSETDDTEWHAGFRPQPSAGTLVLSRAGPGSAQVIDYLNYTNIAPDASTGWATDGNPVRRELFAQPTPLQPNTAIPIVTVVVNEWMASNNRTLADPADGDFEDWFELYNRADADADLGGFWLSDSIAAPAKFIIPAGVTIPAHGYLLVWADGETDQNLPGNDLHLGFKLDADGDLLVLSAPDGTRLDLVAFGHQLTDVSEGRWPDGAGAPLQRLTRPTPERANVWWPAVQFVGARLDSTGLVELRWSTAPGVRYRVESTVDLGAPTWEDVGDPVTATGPEANIMVSPAGQRFFRLVIDE